MIRRRATVLTQTLFFLAVTIDVVGGAGTFLFQLEFDSFRDAMESLFLHEAVTVTNPGLRDVFSWLWAPLLGKWAS